MKTLAEIQASLKQLKADVDKMIFDSMNNEVGKRDLLAERILLQTVQNIAKSECIIETAIKREEKKRGKQSYKEIAMKSLILIFGVMLFVSCNNNIPSTVTVKLPSASEIKADKQALDSNSNVSATVDTNADLAACDANTNGEIDYVKDSNEYYFCANDQWSVLNASVTVSKASTSSTSSSSVTGSGCNNCNNTTVTINGNNNSVGVNGAQTGAVNTASSIDSNDESGLWTSPVTGRQWSFGKFIASTQLLASNKAKALSATFLCPVGMSSPSAVEYKNEMGSGLYDQMGGLFMLVGVTKNTSAGYLDVIVADAAGNFDDATAMNLSQGARALCIVNQ